MKKLIYYILFLLLTIGNTYSQIEYCFALVHDVDGFVFIRNSPKVNENVIDTLKNEYPIYVGGNEGNWFEVYYLKDSKFKSGYIYKGKCESITNFSKFKIKEINDSHIQLTKDSIKIVIKTQPFDTLKNKIRYTHKYGYESIESINGKDFWGTDQGMPSRQYKSIEIFYKNIKVEFPKSEYRNYFQPNLMYTTAYYDPKKDRYFLYLSNSDGAGSYKVLWCFEKDKLIYYTLMGAL